MDLLTYLLLHFAKDKCRTKATAQWYKYNIYKNLVAYLRCYGWDLQKQDETNIRKYMNEFFETIEKELE